MAEGSETLELFLELAAIPSPPGEERAVADRVTAYLRELGLQVDEDDAGARIGSTAGNLLCRLPGRANGGTPLFLCAHLDTVPPQGPLEPVVEDGIVRNAGGTILGADNKAAVVAMLEAARRIVEENRPHAGLELLFTPKEEVGLLGAGAFDHTKLEARARLRLRPGGADRRDHPRRAVRPHDRGALPRPRRARGHGPGGGPLRDRRGGARDRRSPARPDRRGDDGERRPDHGRHRAQHRPRVVQLRGRGALARRAQARRPRPGDARRDRASPRASATARSRPRSAALRRLSPPARRAGRASSRRPRSSAAASRSRRRCTGGGADANVFNAARAAVRRTSRTGWPRSTRRRAHRRRRPRARWST